MSPVALKYASTQRSPFVTDEVLAQIAKYLSGLRRLSVAGCKWVTAEGLLPLLRSTQGQIRELAFESLAVHPSSYTALAKHLTNLTSLSLTFPGQNLCLASEHWPALADFVEALPRLQAFTHYLSSWNTRTGAHDTHRDSRGSEHADDSDDDIRRDRSEVTNDQNQNRRDPDTIAQPTGTVSLQRSRKPMEPKLSATFLRRFIMARGSQLTKLRVHGLAASMNQLEEVCNGCPQLRDLVLQLYESDKVCICYIGAGRM